MLTALDVLGYERPRRLRKRSAGLVGLVVPELDNPIFPAFAQVIESVLAQAGSPRSCAPRPPVASPRTSTSSCCSTGRQRHRLRLRPARRHQRDPDRYRHLVARQLPIVLINGFVDGIGAPFISCDDRAAAHWPSRTWSRSGHRRIGLIIGPDRFLPVQRKLAGFRRR